MKYLSETLEALEKEDYIKLKLPASLLVLEIEEKHNEIEYEHNIMDKKDHTFIMFRIMNENKNIQGYALNKHYTIVDFKDGTTKVYKANHLKNKTLYKKLV